MPSIIHVCSRRWVLAGIASLAIFPFAQSLPLAAQDAAPAKQNLQAAQPKIVIAWHVLLWEGRDIMTWDGAVARLRALRLAGPVHPEFYFTHGASAQAGNWEYWHHEIMAIYGELFQPAGVSFGSISPRASPRYDAVKTAADLVLDPTRAYHGRVVQPDGKPAVGAQVFVLPASNMNGNFLNTDVYLQGTQLRDPLDENWTASDTAGNFVLVPDEKTYWLAALHPSGTFLMRVSEQNQRPGELQLQPWAGVTLSSSSGAAGQSADVSTLPTGAAADWPNFDILSIEIGKQPLEVKVPAGKIRVSRSFKTDQSTTISLPTEGFALKPGEKKSLELKPASDEERQHATNLFEQLHSGENK
jgi:hypothetical protein